MRRREPDVRTLWNTSERRHMRVRGWTRAVKYDVAGRHVIPDGSSVTRVREPLCTGYNFEPGVSARRASIASTIGLTLGSKLSLLYRSSQSNSPRMLLVAISSRECDVESATGSLREGSRDVPAPNVPVVQMLDNLENESPTSLVFGSARRAFESLTIYYEISAARIPEEFAPVRMRLQREWTFNGGFVSRFTITFCFLTPS